MKIEVKERETYSIIDIEFENNEFRLVLDEKNNSIEITKSDGSIEIHPCVSNQIIIK
jgi:hypothetical protein